MPVSLMSYVPHNAVVGRVEDIVQRYGQLHHTKARRQVSGIDGKLFDDVLSKLLADLWQLVNRQLSEVSRIVNAIQ